MIVLKRIPRGKIDEEYAKENGLPEISQYNPESLFDDEKIHLLVTPDKFIHVGQIKKMWYGYNFWETGLDKPFVLDLNPDLKGLYCIAEIYEIEHLNEIETLKDLSNPLDDKILI